MSLMMLRIDVSSPPGVSICSTTSWACSRAARSSERVRIRPRPADRTVDAQHEHRRRFGAHVRGDGEQHEHAHPPGARASQTASPDAKADDASAWR
jgi:hypothetical protein